MASLRGLLWTYAVGGALTRVQLQTLLNGHLASLLVDQEELFNFHRSTDLKVERVVGGLQIAVYVGVLEGLRI